MTHDDRPPAPGSDPPADAAEAPDASPTSTDEGCCGLDVVGIGLIGFGVLISIAIPVVIFVGWIPVAIGALLLWYAKRHSAKDAGSD